MRWTSERFRLSGTTSRATTMHSMPPGLKVVAAAGHFELAFFFVVVDCVCVCVCLIVELEWGGVGGLAGGGRVVISHCTRV